jgi:hypothetical protein
MRLMLSVCLCVCQFTLIKFSMLERICCALWYVQEYHST